MELDAWIDRPRPRDDRCRLRCTDIALAQEDAPREVVALDPVEVVDVDRADAEQREILDHLVADGAGADHRDARCAHVVLGEPVDQAVTQVAIRVHRRGRRWEEQRGQSSARRTGPRSVPPQTMQRPPFSRFSTATLSPWYMDRHLPQRKSGCLGSIGALE